MAAREAGLCFLGANLLWGSTYVVAAEVLEAAPPLVIAFVRFAVASAVMVLLRSHEAPRSKEITRPAGSERWALLVLGVVGFGLAKVLNYEGLAKSTATDAALIINLEAVFTAFFGRLLLGQKLSQSQLGGLTISFLGGLLLVHFVMDLRSDAPWYLKSTTSWTLTMGLGALIFARSWSALRREGLDPARDIFKELPRE